MNFVPILVYKIAFMAGIPKAANNILSVATAVGEGKTIKCKMFKPMVTKLWELFND